MGMVKEFKEFAVKGNMVDMAVGIIIGGAFGKIVSSLVNDVIMPPIGILVGGVDFSKLSVTLKEAVGETAAVTFNYGAFIQQCVDFIIVAFAVFMMVKAVNSMRREEEPAEEEAPAPTTEDLLTEIRDLLANEKGSVRIHSNQ